MVWKVKAENVNDLECILDDEEDIAMTNGHMPNGHDRDGSVQNGDINQNVILGLQRKRRKNKEHLTPRHAFMKICHGNRAESIFWIAFAILGVCVSSIIVYRLVSKYYRYEVVTDVTWKITSRNNFPSITFCDVDLMIGNYFAYCGVPHGGKHENKNLTCKHNANKYKEFKNAANATVWSNGIFRVLKCYTWDGKSCTSSKYFKSVTRLNHTCFTWNWNGDLNDMYGHAYIEFTTNHTKRESDRSFIFGEIHDPKVFEIGMSNSFRLEPTKVFELRIRKTIIKRLPAPYPSRCVTNMPHHIFPGHYTRRTCIDSINYIEMLKRCGDILDYHKMHIPDDLLRRYKRNRTISEALRCMLSYSAQELREVNIETCPIACEKLDLHATTTFHELKHDVKKSPTRDVYAIDIQYHDIDQYRVLEEKQKYSADQLIGEIGGVVGLFLGASFVTLFDVIMHYFRKFFL